MSIVSGLPRERGIMALSLVVALLCGAGMALQSRVNSGLAEELDSASAAAIWSFGSGCVILLVLVACIPSGRAGTAKLVRGLRDGTVPYWALGGGAVGAWFVLSQGLSGALIGVAMFTVAIVAGQTVGSMVIDRIGVAGLPARTITVTRALGAILALAAVILASWGRIGEAGAPWWAYLMPLVAGAGTGWQQAVTGLVRHASDSGLVATAVNFLVGTVLLGIGALVVLIASGPPTGSVRSPILLIGGIVAIGFIFGMAVVVRRIGVLLLGLGTIAGQLAAALVLDALFPVAGHPLEALTVGGAVVALIAVVIAAIPSRASRAPG